MPQRPSPAFLLSHPAHVVALGFGAGLSPKAPGTVGSLWAWLSWLVLAPLLPVWGQGLLIASALMVGWWACKTTVDDLDIADPGFVVWDEVVAMWLILWLVMPTGFWCQAFAFTLFRYFDAAKPGPVAWADTVFKGWGWRGAWGILFDDLVAAFCTLLVITLWRWI